MSSLKNPDFESAELKLISAATLKADAHNVYTNFPSDTLKFKRHSSHKSTSPQIMLKF